MPRYKRKQRECRTCGRPVHGSIICRRCGIELRELLIGGNDADAQPGIIWYIQRLRETAYGQSRTGRSLATRSQREGYALLTNRRAIELLARISATLALWDGHCEALRARYGHETGLVHMGTAERRLERLEVRRARYVAATVPLIRKHSPDAHRLHADMLGYARQAWRIINRPNDICCGPCPTLVQHEPNENETPCATLLYAEENSSTVVCPQCHTLHSVEELRTGLREQVRDMLFTGPELLKLMETRLNDRMSKSTFYQLIRDHRLQPRHRNDAGADQFTYNDVCEAREKPKPTRKHNAKSA